MGGKSVLHNTFCNWIWGLSTLDGAKLGETSRSWLASYLYKSLKFQLYFKTKQLHNSA